MKSASLPYLIAMLLLVLFAFGMSAFVSRVVFERLPHLEDEVAYLYQAKVFAQGQLVAPIPAPRRAYWQPFVLDDTVTGTRFGKYTPGWSAVLALGVALGQPWLINALFAALTVALVYRLGAAVFNRDVGLIGAALTAFSPMALLLNASLMGHTVALCYIVTFIYAYWCMERDRRPLRWGILAGLMLGLLVITRPLPAVALALPFVAWSGVRLLVPFWKKWQKVNEDTEADLSSEITPPLLVERGLGGEVWSTLKPLLAIAFFTGLLALATPAFNLVATGNPRENLYERVWSYDKIGFGECCGRSGHTLEKAFRHARFDLSLTAADLFGWMTGDITFETTDHWINGSDYFPNIGLSFLLIPFGVVAGVLWGAVGTQQASRITWLIGWGVVAVALAWGGMRLPLELQQNPTFAWIYIGFAIAWTLLPILILPALNPAARYAWLLWSVALCVFLMQMTYWIGSQRYSTRYYYEALASLALLSALPLAWLMRAMNRFFTADSPDKPKRAPVRWRYSLAVYGVLVLVLLYSLYAYSTPRIDALTGYNLMTLDVLEGIQQRRTGDQPVLVLVTGPDAGDDRVRWRALGELMVLTSPFLDSDIVGAWDYGAEGVREQILASFPDRQVIEMDALGDVATFRDAATQP
jgi:hypothetical protein